MGHKRTSSRSRHGEVITEALHLYVEGLSLSKIRDVIYQHHGYRISDGSILNWTRKYAKLVRKLEKRIKPKVKGRIHLDEVQLKVGKKHAAYQDQEAWTGCRKDKKAGVWNAIGG